MAPAGAPLTSRDRLAGAMTVTPRTADTAIALVRRRTKRPLLVAIDGHSAAGKSTLARSMAAALPDVQVVHVDDFYRPMDEAERLALRPDEGYDRYFDWQRLQLEVLAPLRAGSDTSYRRYEWDAGSLGGLAVVRAEGIVIVEGVYSFRPELRPLYDLSIFVATPPATRRMRQVTRSDSDAWTSRCDAAERFYVATHRPEAAADLVVDGLGPDAQADAGGSGSDATA
jgi:uridine kinase